MLYSCLLSAALYQLFLIISAVHYTCTFLPILTNLGLRGPERLIQRLKDALSSVLLLWGGKVVPVRMAHEDAFLPICPCFLGWVYDEVRECHWYPGRILPHYLMNRPC